MKLTEALRLWAKQNCGLAADATDDQIREALGKKLFAGELTATKLAELTADKQADPKEMVGKMVADAVATQVATLTESTKTFMAEMKTLFAAKAPETKVETKTEPVVEKTIERGLSDEDVNKLVEKALARHSMTNQPAPTGLFARAAAMAPDARVKGEVENYDRTRQPAIHGMESKHVALRGQRAKSPAGHGLDFHSQSDAAIIGAYCKWAGKMHMTEREKDLLHYAAHELPWTGTLDNEKMIIDSRKLTEVERKALLDESSPSGGINATPLILEDSVIMTPILYGEIFPLVTVETRSFGRRFTEPVMGRPTVGAATEGTAPSLFDTTSFVSALSTNVFVCQGQMEIGKDFEEDSPANFGNLVIKAFGESMMQWLDEQVMLGDGTTEPLGVLSDSGISATSPTNAGGPIVLADAEALKFGVDKAHRNSKNGTTVYIGTETNYKRLRAIPVAAGYQARVHGMNYDDWMVAGTPYKVCTQMTNQQLVFANMAWYKMIRRLGVQVAVVEGDKELTLKNMRLFVVRMRYGGRLQLSTAAAKFTALPA